MSEESVSVAAQRAVLQIKAEHEEAQRAAQAEQTRKARQSALIFPYQKETFSRLLATAEAFANENWFGLPVLPRWHPLIVAPSGTGKTSLANTLAKVMNWPIFFVYTSRWIVAGGRGRQTWDQITNWLSEQKGKCIVFLDEIDKIYTPDPWTVHLRTEVFQLLDRNLPPDVGVNDTIRLSDEIEEKLEEEDEDSAKYKRSSIRLSNAKEVLKRDCFIIAAGAFQDLWEHRPKSLGFGSEDDEPTAPTLTEMKKVLQTELLNRFGHVIAMPYLTEVDYHDMIAKTAPKLPEWLRSTFTQIAERDIEQAIEDDKGARFVEECITQALLEAVEPAPETRKPNFKPLNSPDL